MFFFFFKCVRLKHYNLTDKSRVPEAHELIVIWRRSKSPEISHNETCTPLSGSQIDVPVLLISYLQVVLTMSKYGHKYDSKMTREWMAVSEWNSTAVSWAFNRVACWLLMNDKLAIGGPIALKFARDKMKNMNTHRHSDRIRWESTISAGALAHVVIESQRESARCEHNPYTGFILRSSDYIRSKTLQAAALADEAEHMALIYLIWKGKKNPKTNQPADPWEITWMTLTSEEETEVLGGHANHIISGYPTPITLYLGLFEWNYSITPGSYPNKQDETCKQKNQGKYLNIQCFNKISRYVLHFNG